MDTGKRYRRRAGILLVIPPAILLLHMLLTEVWALRFAKDTGAWNSFMHAIDCIRYVGYYAVFPCIGLCAAGLAFAVKARRAGAAGASLLCVAAVAELLLALLFCLFTAFYLTYYAGSPPWQPLP